MALDWPAFGHALWRVNDELGIRPEWQLPVISLETAGTFDPAIMNSGGCVGLNQLCPSSFRKYVGASVDEYRKWRASSQLSGPILNYWRDAQAFGPIRSSTKLMLAQFGHGLVHSAPDLDSVVFAASSPEYEANCPSGRPCSLDPTRKGFVTVRDIANVLAYRARTPAVKDAIARAYGLRPDAQPTDPVYGFDFGHAEEIITPPSQGGGKLLATVSATALAIAAGYGVYRARKAL